MRCLNNLGFFYKLYADFYFLDFLDDCWWKRCAFGIVFLTFCFGSID